MNRKDLEDRLLDFAVMIVDIVDEIPTSKGINHLLKQLARSGTSPALNYAESQSAESRKDFIHKMSISLKELRESLMCLIIIQRSKKVKTNPGMAAATKECDELVSIFVKSIQTAKKKLR
jgi:four helix bundle protein